MASFVRRFAYAALLVGAAFSINSQAQAVTTVSLTGGPVAGYPGNGTSTGENNVMNAPNSGLVDGSAAPGGGHLVGSVIGTNASVSVTGTSGGFWGVNWWFAGAESGDSIQLIANSTAGAPLTFTFTEADQNNNNNGASPQIGPQYLFTTFQKGDGLIDFMLRDITKNPLKDPLLAGAYTNNMNPATNAIPNTNGLSSLVFAYLTDPVNAPAVTDKLTTTLTNSLWFMFAFNDNGSNDDNHDDFVGFAQVFATNGGQIPGVPLPPALFLFGSALLGLTLLARRRRVSYERT